MAKFENSIQKTHEAKRSTKDLPVVVYTPELKLRSPKAMAKEMWKDLLASRELAWRLM